MADHEALALTQREEVELTRENPVAVRTVRRE
jgi:hypothetical protein